MAATADPFDERALGFRVNTLERNETRNADKLGRVDDQVQEHGNVLAAQHEQIAGLTKAVESLASSVTWGSRGVIAAAITYAAAHFAG